MFPVTKGVILTLVLTRQLLTDIIPLQFRFREVFPALRTFPSQGIDKINEHLMRIFMVFRQFYLAMVAERHNIDNVATQWAARRGAFVDAMKESRFFQSLGSNLRFYIPYDLNLQSWENTRSAKIYRLKSLVPNLTAVSDFAIF
jgi:hypothetical protein